MEPEIRYTTTDDGASIAYATMGVGPMVIMLPVGHSFSGRLRVYPAHRALCDAIARRFTLVEYDGRGMGLSARERREYDLEARLKDLEAVIGAASGNTFALYGRSYGGLAAMAYAARRPQRVARLVLVDSFSSGERFFSENPAGRVLAALGTVTAEQWEFVSEAIAARVTPADAGPDATRDLGALFRETWAPADFLAHRQAVREIDVSGALAAISVPTLVVSTTAGPVAVFEHSRELASAIPNARLLRVAARWTGWDERDYDTLLAFLGANAGPAEVGPQASGVRTVLFTDLVGHTEMMQRLGDARGRGVLREHESITRDIIKQYGGAEIKTDGDSFMVSFGSVTAGMECAVELQRAFARRNETADEPLHVRIGLNAGEPIAEDGDLFGSTVILASRICAQAAPGEILIPEPVRHLLSGKAFTFSDRGEHAMKGFDDPVRLYEVRWRE